MSDKLHFEDLTQITCPFGLLDDDTQQRLAEWPHGYELWGAGAWDEACDCALYQNLTFRAKPKRVTTWHNVYDSHFSKGYEARGAADERAFEDRTCVYRIERDEDGSNPTIYVESVND